MYIQCRIIIPVFNWLIYSFLHFPQLSHNPYDVLGTENKIVRPKKKKKKKSSPDFMDLMRIHERGGRKQDLNKQFH